MIQPALAVSAGLICGLYGLRLASEMQAEAARLKRWAALLPHLALLLGEGSLTLPGAFTACADEDAIPDKLLRNMSGAMQEQPLLTPAGAFDQICRPCRERAALLRMFDRMGRGSAESRMLAVTQASGEIHLLADAAESRCARDARLWRTLGFTLGACLTILLL